MANGLNPRNTEPQGMYPDVGEAHRRSRAEAMSIRNVVPRGEERTGVQEGPRREEGGVSTLTAMVAPRYTARKEREQVKKYGKDMVKAQGFLAQAFASTAQGDLRQAAVYMGEAYKFYPDGRQVMEVGKPRYDFAQKIADDAGVDEVITVADPDGNFRYLPLNKKTVGNYLEQGRALMFNPKEYIMGRVKTQAGIEAFNADQQQNSVTEHPDGHISILQVDENTGKRRTENFDNREAFMAKYGPPPGGWQIPEGEQTRLKREHEATKVRREGFMTTPRGTLELGDEGEKPTIVEGTEALPSKALETTPVTSRMFVQNKEGKWGWTTQDGKFHVAEGVAEVANKAKDEKGKLTEKDILKVKTEALKAYNDLFLDKGTQQYAEGRGTAEDKRKAVLEAIKLVVPEEYWPPPKLGKPEKAPDGKWYSKDQFDRYWPVPDPSSKKKTLPDKERAEQPEVEIRGPLLRGREPSKEIRIKKAGEMDLGGDKYSMDLPGKGPVTRKKIEQRKGIKEPRVKRRNKGIGRQEMKKIDKVAKKEGGREWHQLPRKDRRGDIHETINDLEPRKSDPFPQAAVKAIKKYAKQGLSIEEIDLKLVGDITAGRLATWIMHLSD